jgi:cytochrome c
MLDSFELNKILGATLGTFLGLHAVHLAAEAIFAPVMPAKPGFDIKVPENPATQPSPEARPAEPPIEQLLANASVERGEMSAGVCKSCHSFEKGGPNLVGPNLWGVVGRPVASVPGFNYSPALKAKGGAWTFNELNKFLTNPRGYVPGTLMTFSGIERPQQRADVIDYLRTLSDNPLPLPSAAEAAPATTGAKQGG